MFERYPQPEGTESRATRFRPLFRDRTDAGRQLRTALTDRDVHADLAVVSSPSAAIVGRPVADALGVPLELLVTRRIYPPGDAAVTIAGVTEDGTVWVDEGLLPRSAAVSDYLRREIEREQTAAQRTAARHRSNRERPPLADRSVVVVTEGLDDPATVVALCQQLAEAGAARITVATPVAHPDSVERLPPFLDGVVAVEMPSYFPGVRGFYETFDEPTDEVVRTALRGDRVAETDTVPAAVE